MDYHFDEYVDRKGTDSIKWEVGGPDVLPLWIADMDFKTAPAIQEALRARVEHGIFGYTKTPGRFYDAIIGWWQKRHGYALQKGWIRPVTGVIPALSAIIRALTAPGDKVLVQSPVYNHFYESITHAGRQVVESRLPFIYDHFFIDFTDLEAKVADPAVKLMMLCSPHNPLGRVWDISELQRIGEICAKHDVVVLSDEIHSDLVYPGRKHIPFVSLNDINGLHSVTVSSPSKTFNLAGLQVGCFFSESPKLMKQINDVLTMQEMELLSPFAIEALIAAYEQGEDWLDSLLAYLSGNFAYLTDFCAKHLPQINVVPLEATYLVWLDCRSILSSSAKFAAKLVRDEKVWVNAGTMYGRAGEGFLRINIACPRPLLADGLNRFAKGIRTG